MPAPAPAPLLYPTCAECAGVGFKGIPEWLWDMEEDIGVTLFRAFMDRHGGCELSLAREPKASDALDVTPDLAPAYAWLHKRFGAGKLMVPLGPTALRARLAWTVFKLLEGGASLAEAARATGATTRAVSRYKSNLRRVGALKPPAAPSQRTPR